MSTPITLLPGSLPAGYCISSAQDLNIDIVSRISAFLNDTFPGVWVGATAPTADYRDRVWFNTTNGRWYWFTTGDWFTQARTPAGPSGERMIWLDTEANLWLFDGGDGTNPSSVSPTATTGAMWMRDTTADARFPLGIGTLPSGTVIAIATPPAGDETVTLDETQIPAHTHGPGGGLSKFWGFKAGAGAPYGSTLGTDTVLESLTDATGGGLSHTNMPPWYPIILAKRTSRAWEKV